MNTLDIFFKYGIKCNYFGLFNNFRVLCTV